MIEHVSAGGGVSAAILTHRCDREFNIFPAGML